MAKQQTHLPCQGQAQPTAMRLLDISAVVAMTGLSESTVLRRVRAGVLPPPRKIGPGAVRWIEAELAEAISRLPVADWAAQSEQRAA